MEHPEEQIDDVETAVNIGELVIEEAVFEFEPAEEQIDVVETEQRELVARFELDFDSASEAEEDVVETE